MARQDQAWKNALQALFPHALEFFLPALEAHRDKGRPFEFLEQGGSGAMITLRENQVVPLPFEEMLDAATGKTQVRLVKVDSIQYRIARQYMIRIEKRDLEARSRLEQMAVAAHLTPDAFLERFSYITDAVY